MSAPTADAQPSWDDVLDTIERDLDGAAALLERLHGSADASLPRVAPWSLPSGLPGFPAARVQRARDLLARVHDLTADLESAMSSNRRQRRLTAAVAPRAARRPVYVDAAV